MNLSSNRPKQNNFSKNSNDVPESNQSMYSKDALKRIAMKKAAKMPLNMKSGNNSIDP